MIYRRIYFFEKIKLVYLYLVLVDILEVFEG